MECSEDLVADAGRPLDQDQGLGCRVLAARADPVVERQRAPRAAALRLRAFT
ncbi:hypothetical protein ABZX99_34165 [Streptomyces antibioticus]|uniref:hypothetical protein n=1 Tax=Streptomyces antibioticus TaxID=1890 RepID=UPI0033A4AB4B